MIQILKKYFEKLIIAILSTDIEYKMNTEPRKFQEGLDKSSDKFMYITIKSIKKTLGKYIEMTGLYIGLPMLMIFLIL